MNRLWNTLACCTLFAAATTAQDHTTGTAGPSLTYEHDAAMQSLTVTCGPLSSPNGCLILLGSFEGTLQSLGKGLPSILAHSAVIAMTFTPGETFSIATTWPPIHVLLQAVEVSFAPFGVSVSQVVQVGEAPLSDQMAIAIRQARDDATSSEDRNGDGVIDSHDWQ